MDIRQLEELGEFEETLDIQRSIWGAGDIDIVPSHLTRACADNGSIILGAFLQDRMAGFLFCFPTHDPGLHLMHMVGVLPEHQKQDIGHRLMLGMKARARERGVRKIVWTFDPLESVNANLYLHKMGGICRRYVEDYYVMHGSKTHAGIPADRFKMELFLHQEDREALLSREEQEPILVDIPADFQELKAGDMRGALDWRNRTRALFIRHMNEEGYAVVDFRYRKGEELGRYVLER